MQHWARLQAEYDAFFCVVDLHALTLPWSPATLTKNTLSKAAEIVAAGVDPEQSVLFVQSHVPAHTELAWILTCVARMGELRRMIQFKEKSKGESESVGVGLFTYPVLQAADVLLYRAHGVPVGEDQRQHIELMRDLAGRFNSLFGPTLVLPEAFIPPAGAKIMALDDAGQKMSKSDQRPLSSVELTDSPDVIRKKIRSAVTDSGREVQAGPDKPALTNLLTVYSLFAGIGMDDAQERFAGSGYGDFKTELADVLVEALRPMRERYEALVADPGELGRVLALGAKKATEVAAQTLADVRARVGLLAHE
jgi:tryptophanyl-tRNA synthetase